MSSIIDKLEKRYRIPCGPMEISADGVCRRRLKDKFDSLLDRLTDELHPELQKPEIPDGHEVDEDGNIVVKEEKQNLEQAKKAREKAEGEVEKEISGFDKAFDEMFKGEEDLETKKQRLIDEGKMKAEVKAEIKKYEEKLMGNSKMLQDTSGKIQKR